MDVQKFFQSQSFAWLLKGLGGLILLLVVFQLGVFVGFRKAGFSYHWAENYHRTFGGPRSGFLGDWDGRDFTSGHGLAGTVIKVEGSTIVAKGSDGVEKLIMVSSATTLEQGHQPMLLANVKPDDRIVVLGTPQDDGSIDAKLIRVFGGFFSPPPTPLGAPVN